MGDYVQEGCLSGQPFLLDRANGQQSFIIMLKAVKSSLTRRRPDADQKEGWRRSRRPMIPLLIVRVQVFIQKQIEQAG
jgi:hypothetical protein